LFWSSRPQRFLTLLFSSLPKQEVTARVFMPLFECPSKRCVMNKSKGNVILQLRASKFLRFQEVCTLPWTLLHWSISDTCFITLFSAHLLINYGIMNIYTVNLQAKIQELAEHVPKGHIPRTMTVHLRGELTRKVVYSLPIALN